jgi:ABC-type cobalamin transport system permease subunit
MENRRNHSMARSSTLFLQVVVVLIGICALAALLWEPHLEGRNARATFVEIYFRDPFLVYIYIASIPFFVALYQAFKVLGYVGQNEVFLQRSVRALRIIKYCAFVTAAAIVAADVYLMVAARLRDSTDDPAGAVMLGIIATFAAVVIATAAAVFERVLQNAVYMKSENDLTV